MAFADSGIYAARCRRAEDKSDKKRDRFVDRATSDPQLPSDLHLREPLGEESLDCLRSSQGLYVGLL